jgi:hypothetical protein
MPVHAQTLRALAQFPQQLRVFYDAIPRDFRLWSPESWEGCPSETFPALEQICHVLDIEVDGYQSRLRRTITEDKPFLPSIDGYELAKIRDYAGQDGDAALEAIRVARAETVELISEMRDVDLDRRATFEGYGEVTARGLVHYLCSHDQQHIAGLQWLIGKIESARVPAGDRS